MAAPELVTAAAPSGGAGRRVAEHGDPVGDVLPGQQLVGARPLVATPTSLPEVAACAEQFEGPLAHVLVDEQLWAQAGVQCALPRLSTGGISRSLVSG